MILHFKYGWFTKKYENVFTKKLEIILKSEKRFWENEQNLYKKKYVLKKHYFFLINVRFLEMLKIWFTYLLAQKNSLAHKRFLNVVFHKLQPTDKSRLYKLFLYGLVIYLTIQFSVPWQRKNRVTVYVYCAMSYG